MPRRDNGFEDLVGALRRSNACADHPPLVRSLSPAGAANWWEKIQQCSPSMRREHLRWFGRNDLFFLLVYLLNRMHFLADERKANWTFERCYEVQDSPNNHLDLWSREHFKSEILTFGKSVQDILIDPEITIGIFSHTRPMAKDFLVLIKREFQFNALLKETYDDILWDNPRLECREAGVSWSENEGITVKRRGNPKESTIEAWGLTDGQPTGKRYKRLIYDDVVARDSVTPLMIQITTNEFDNSLLLTASDPPVFRYVGTYQEFGDTTDALVKRRVGKLRLRGPFDEHRKPACFSDEKMAFYKNTLTTKVFALQILLDPTQAKDPTEIGFSKDWLQYWDAEDTPLTGMNKYIVVDPAGNNADSNSFFAMWVVALGSDKCVRVLDIICDKYDLEERWEAVFSAVQKWDPLKVGYESYALQSDIEHFRYRQKELNQQFTIVKVGTGGSKDTRIGWLIPPFRDHRILLPKRGIRKTLKDGTEVDMVRKFIDEEFLVWPYSPKHRDMLDALSRLFDPVLNVVWPKRWGSNPADYNGGGFGNGPDNLSGSWMSG